MQYSLVSVLSFATAVYGHGRVTSPPAREAGSAFGQACGQQMLSIESSDRLGNIQGLRQQAKADFDPTKCRLELCKGIPFADAKSGDVQKFSAGQTVPIKVQIGAPHTGIANVSVVDTSTNSIIGQPLIEFQNYASTKSGVAKNNTDFSVTMPDTLPSACGTAGACVLQWWWDSDEAKQTYMSCIDFTFGGAAGGGASNGGSGNSSTANSGGATAAKAASSSCQ
ncbi:hypothetical protein PpBr36_02503 [Pyricularia pennisetigena]|uniref:hypothetical protein n=1 Tax=Pyricularia pennisetigena TaxID=1578925 RepID=UPI001153685A|nr:hypothetical protein PpBr36_02503 [Pyricularia pennisetigena]TLS30637.1 hypothetical protein PpBr36_02503 [Pyricularia pennisetigena]